MRLIKLLTVKVIKPNRKAQPSTDERRAITQAGVSLCKSVIAQSKSASVPAPFEYKRAA